MEYGNNFSANTSDKFNFTVVDNVNTEESRDWVFDIYNIEKSITINPPIAPVVSIRTPPYASILCTSTIDPEKRIASTSITNDFRILLNNNGSCTNRVLKAIINAPAPFISLVTPNTTQYGGTIINNVTSMTIDYTGKGGLLKNAVDKIIFKAADNYEIGEATNIKWDIRVNEGQGYADTRVPEGLKQHVDFYTPDPSVEAYISPEGILNTKTNVHFNYFINNTGMGDNDIRKVVIEIPNDPNIILSGLTNVTSSPVGSVSPANTSATQIIISFGYKEFKPGDTVVVQFDMTNSFHISETNVSFPSWAANVTNGPLFPTDVKVGKEQDVEIRIPSGISLGYIKKPPQGVLFTIDTNKNIEYRIENNSSLPISKAVIFITNQNFDIKQVTSDVITNDADHIKLNSNNSIITLRYDLDNTLARDLKDTIFINLNFAANITKYTVVTLLDGSKTQPDKPGRDVLEIRKADFGRITGIVLPFNEKVNIQILDSNGNPVKVGTKYTNQYYKTDDKSIVDATDGADGIYMLDFVPPGTYTLKFSSENYRISYEYEITVTANKYKEVDDVKLKNKMLDSGDNVNNAREIIAEDDCTTVEFPLNSVLNDFYLDIYKKKITDPELNINLSFNNDTIIKPKYSKQLNIYDFMLQDTNEEDIDEIEIGETITIIFCYSDAEISLQGWEEDSLAIYYYKEITGEWVKLGGEIDKDSNTITITVNYLHSTYAIFGSKEVKYVKIYGDLKCWPNPFLPGRGYNTYDNLKISFIFKEPVDSFKFVVYDLIGRKIYENEYSGNFTQGEIYWDGKDNNDYFVKSGAYIYQIETESEYYRGKVMILK